MTTRLYTAYNIVFFPSVCVCMESVFVCTILASVYQCVKCVCAIAAAAGLIWGFGVCA